MRLNRRRLAALAPFSLLLSAFVHPVYAGGWGTQAQLSTNAYNGTIALDAAGNMTSLWYQNDLPNGTAVNEIWASTAAFGQAWSAPVNVSGPIGVASGNPSVRTNAAGTATAVYNNSSGTGMFSDHPLGGSWSTPAATSGVVGFYTSNDHGDQSIAWGGGGPRGIANPVRVVHRSAGGAWSTAATLATGAYVALDGNVVAPDGTMAVSWESYSSVCGSRTCKTSNWTLHVSTLAPGAQTWVDSGPLMGPSSTQHFGQMAADGLGDLGVISISNGNIVSLVRHAGAWGTPAVVAPLTTIGYYTGTGRDNRIYASDSSGHATFVGWNQGLTSLLAADGNLTTNTWSTPNVISGSDQDPGYFYFTMSQSGAAIAFWNLQSFNGSGETTWRAATRPAGGKPWNAPATAGTSFDAGGNPESVAVNTNGQAAVVFHGYSSDFLTYILYTNTYHP
jgi:hypothetical protein